MVVGKVLEPVLTGIVAGNMIRTGRQGRYNQPGVFSFGLAGLVGPVCDARYAAGCCVFGSRRRSRGLAALALAALVVDAAADCHAVLQSFSCSLWFCCGVCFVLLCVVAASVGCDLESVGVPVLWTVVPKAKVWCRQPR